LILPFSSLILVSGGKIMRLVLDNGAGSIETTKNPTAEQIFMGIERLEEMLGWGEWLDIKTGYVDDDPAIYVTTQYSDTGMGDDV
jgi:DNA/RNA endonuclease YhcR with UshA esterase domain